MNARDQRALLQQIARNAMLAQGFEPDWPPRAEAELARLGEPALPAIKDLRDLPWSSIDNDESRDLDQLEVCVPDGKATRLLVAIADVDALVAKDSALDAHARTNTTSVYTPAEIFPMLPEALSTDRTSLNEDSDRAAIVVEMVIDEGGTIAQSDLYRARVRNRAKLTYTGVAAWLDGAEHAMPALAADREIAGQVRLQDRIARALDARREEEGALDFARTELKPVMEDGMVRELRTEETNRAREIIENFMVAANGATARFLAAHGVSCIRRVVRSPERWDRIVDLAGRSGHTLPGEPDSRALEGFLKAARGRMQADDFAELSLSVIKLLGRGEYVAEPAGSGAPGHFALAVSNYTHSTAPNRRFPDLVTQRLIKAAIAGSAPPYTLEELTPLAAHCTKQEDGANKVERLVRKAAAALWLSDRIGQEFDAVVTGASKKGTWVRLYKPPIEGRLERGFEGLDVGDRVRVRLLSTNPEKGFIDFGVV
jgi:exoribonuclease-2